MCKLIRKWSNISSSINDLGCVESVRLWAAPPVQLVEEGERLRLGGVEDLHVVEGDTAVAAKLLRQLVVVRREEGADQEGFVNRVIRILFGL